MDLNRLFTPCLQEVLFLFLSDPPEEAECELRNYEVHRDHTPYPQAAILAYAYVATVVRVVRQRLPTTFDSKYKIFLKIVASLYLCSIYHRPKGAPSEAVL